MSQPRQRQTVEITPAKGRPFLHWVGKKPLERVTAFPTQLVETFNPLCELGEGGLLFHGDNKEVLAYLLANGYRSKVKLVYIDPPFDSGADYVRKVELRGAKNAAKLEGEGYGLGEQIQYTDIWANDNYLQFMYERLLLLKELLAEEGSIYLHCDSKRSHMLRCLLEEVFGPECFLSEVIWKRTSAHSDASFYGQVHDTLFFFGKGRNPTWNSPRTDYEAWYVARYYSYTDKTSGRKFKSGDLSAYGLSGGGYEYSWKGVHGIWRCPESTMKDLDAAGKLYLTENGIPRLKQYLDETDGMPVQTLWDDIQPVVSWAGEKDPYPTQKPEALVERIIRASSNSGDLVLDCFIGSGTTAAVAQKLGRRWIGCDINKGAIQTTGKRLQTVILEQAQQRKTRLVQDVVKPATLAFSVYRVNDYDLQAQHNEAINLACEHIGITRTRSDSFFDGTLGSRLVKIIPLTHPLTLLDLQLLQDELRNRPQEDRDIVIVCLGKETAVDPWVEQWNKKRPVAKVDGQGRPVGWQNRIELIELRTDKRYGKFFVHQPACAQVDVCRENGRIVVDVQDFISPTIVERLNIEQSLFKSQIIDWRAMVDCVMIDTAYDGQVFKIAVSDVPVNKTDLVSGHYEISAPNGSTTVAVKVIDMLGEEVLVTAQVR